jgi:hypothetical protein
MNIERELRRQWGLKIHENMQWSDSIRAKEFNDFRIETKKIISDVILNERQFKMYERQFKMFEKQRVYIYASKHAIYEILDI